MCAKLSDENVNFTLSIFSQAHSMQIVVCAKVFASIMNLDICCATLHTKYRMSKKKQGYGTIGGGGGEEK